MEKMSMTDQQREERAVWKLEQGGYRVQKQGNGYLITTVNSADEVESLAELAAFAETVYNRVWTGRHITPSA
jgi:hypothetical protein